MTSHQRGSPHLPVVRKTRMEITPLKRLVGAGIIAGMLLAVLAIGNYFVLTQSLEAGRNSAAEINISGRQRMLTYKIDELSTAYVTVSNPSERLRLRRRLLKAIDAMEKEHRDLTSETLQKFSPRIRAMYFAAPLFADRQVKAFLRAGRALAQAKATTRHADNPALLAIRKAADGPLLDALNTIVHQRQRESEEHIRTVQSQGLGITLLILAVMLLMVLFLFRPIVRRLRESANELAASEAHNRVIVETMVDAMITIDKSGIVESFNPAAERIFGYPPDEVIGNNVKMLMPPPYHGQHDGYLKHYLDTGEAKIIGTGREVEGKRKDGSIFPMDLAVSEMDMGGIRCFSGIIRDISERRAAEQAIADKNRELKLRGRYDHSYAEVMTLFSSTYDRDKALSGLLSILADHHPYPVSAIYAYDEWSGRLELAVSHGAPDTLKSGFERGEGLIGQVAIEGKLSLLDEVDAKGGLAIETGILKFSPAAVIAAPISFQDKLLGVLVLAASKPLIDLDGSFIERLGAQLGVAMNNIRQYGDLKALSDQLKQRGEEISQKNIELEDANRMKSEFLANMSHELRTPLNAIIGFSEVLKDGVMGEMSKEQTEYIGDIFDSGQHLLSLINDILDLSKIEAGRMELDLGDVDVPELLGNSMSIIREKAMAHHIKLDLDIGDEVESCRMDARKAKQMVYNLLSNAVKFTPDGGSVRIRARKIKSESGSGLERKKGDSLLSSPAKPGTGKSETVPFFPDPIDLLEISVADTGIGISGKDQEKLFQPFTQVDSSLSRKFEGTGLGLVMVKRLAELHGGTVAVESEEGRGSTFTVCLPYRGTNGAEDETVPRSVGAMVEVEPGEDAPLVLIIEDDDYAADIMRVQLEGEGYRSFSAATAEDGLDWLKGNTPDLISLDILLPGMDGWDFLTEMKKRKTVASVPVVIVSIVTDGNERKAFSLGASSVLQKPVSKKQLIEAISALGFSCGKAGRPLKVLVVDDDPKAVELVSRHLESGRCTALRAYGGAEAIDTAIREHPDLIVLDLMMPEVTGFDVVNALKDKEETKAIPIIILTAKVITEQDRRELNSGVLKIIGKDGFHHGSFMAEVRRAGGATGRQASDNATAKADEAGKTKRDEKEGRPPRKRDDKP